MIATRLQDLHTYIQTNKSQPTQQIAQQSNNLHPYETLQPTPLHTCLTTTDTL